jgi:DNA polymerase III delta prime subunit
MTTHHAYLLKVGEEVRKEELINQISVLEIAEFAYFELPVLGVEFVRQLTEKAYLRPKVGNKQLLVVYLKTITKEAQQALLKILEEPPQSTVFLFCVPQNISLLSTLLSRFHVLPLFTDAQQGISSELAFKNFVSLPVSDRISEISTRLAAKDVKWVTEIKNGLLAKMMKNSSKFSPDILNTLHFIANHLQTRGAANKLLLEELALTIK